MIGRDGDVKSQSRVNSLRGRFLRAGFILSLAWVVLFPRYLDAQVVSFRFVALDMYGGAVLPVDSKVGVAFGGRLGFADMFGGLLRLGLELGWWTAQQQEVAIDVNDIAGGLAIWMPLVSEGALRPYIGLGGGFHSVDASPASFAVEIPPLLALQLSRLDGVRFGGQAYAGLVLRLSGTGAIWGLLEYRYTAVSRIHNHQFLAGIRLSGSERP